MRYMNTGSVAVLVAALALFVSTRSFAETRVAEAAPAGTASISGKVTDAEGNAVAGATVKVMAKMVHEKKNLAEEGGDKPKRPTALKEATTGADGVYTIDGLPAGEYTVTAMTKEKGAGRANVTLTDGQKAADVHIKLTPRAAKKAE